MNLQEQEFFFSKISTPYQTFLIPFVIVNAEFQRIFKPSLAMNNFPTSKNIYNKYEKFGAHSSISNYQTFHNILHQRNLTYLHGSQTVT